MNERNIIATFHRRHQELRKRHYARIDTSIPRITQLLILEGEPGDVVELAHAVTGMQLGTLKMKVGGHLVTDWIWEK